MVWDNGIETCILSYIHVNYHELYIYTCILSYIHVKRIASPGSMHDMIQGARGWCTEMTQRDRMGREVGGEFRMGNTYIPMADSCQCMAKPIQYCKVINK